MMPQKGHWFDPHLLMINIMYKVLPVSVCFHSYLTIVVNVSVIVMDCVLSFSDDTTDKLLWIYTNLHQQQEQQQ